MQYKKKPVVIDAIQLMDVTKADIRDIFGWVESFGDDPVLHFQVWEGATGLALKVNTLEGTSYNVPEGYYIIRGIAGEYYPCAPDIFVKTYEEA